VIDESAADMTEFQLYAELRRYRDSARMTQERVARAIGCAPSTISKFESGDRVPTVRQTGYLLRLYGVPQSERQKLIDASQVQLTPVTHGEFRQMRAQIADMCALLETVAKAVMSTEVAKHD
jgi:transcriptional regulator with XRE-family HTH domain